MKGRAQRMRGFISKWRVAVGIAPFKKLVANKDANQDRFVNPICTYLNTKFAFLVQPF